MTKKTLKANGNSRGERRSSLATRLETLRYLDEINSSFRARRKYATNIQHIAEALVEADTPL